MTKQMPVELLGRYLANPVAMDPEVRSAMGLRTDRYYTVSVYPVPGLVREDSRPRTVSLHKISKSS